MLNSMLAGQERDAGGYSSLALACPPAALTLPILLHLLSVSVGCAESSLGQSAPQLPFEPGAGAVQGLSDLRNAHQEQQCHGGTILQRHAQVLHLSLIHI